jgi:hypothetical protein
MTVCELIQKLLEFDANMEVGISDEYDHAIPIDNVWTAVVKNEDNEERELMVLIG